ncbi:interferon-induced protein 44-like [Hoplias malabaricus]|uniref:interferon-induced protein 44-like n=1 Tax=Hoplias malabaricus TaxID=27720 RepID=UPI0034623E45
MDIFRKFFKTNAQPSPSPEFDKPWRPVTWSDSNKEQMIKKLRKMQLGIADLSHLRILLHGPVGAGKSSFINSVRTVFQSCTSTTALTDTTTGDSFTTKLKIHRVKKSPGSFYPFVFADIMGLEQEKGVCTEDIISILQGHIKNHYTFKPVSPIDKTNDYYNSEPKQKDKVHCLVSVLPADKITLMSEDVSQKMKQVREKARNLEIPQVVIMSKVDNICPLVSEDLKSIYTSRKIKEKMQECSYRLGVPMNCIFPVKNYYEEITNVLEVDILILMATTNIVQFAKDYVEDQTYIE